METLLATLTQAAEQADFTEAWQRIADHFDALFTTEASIDQLKQTILQLAVMGKLVPRDPKDEPASILLDKIAKEKARLIKERKTKKLKTLPKINDEEKPFELQKGWTWARLGEVTNYGVSDKVGPDDADDSTWVLELEDVEKETSKLLKKVRFSDRLFRSSKSQFYKGDVIYGKLRPQRKRRQMDPSVLCPSSDAVRKICGLSHYKRKREIHMQAALHCLFQTRYLCRDGTGE